MRRLPWIGAPATFASPAVVRAAIPQQLEIDSGAVPADARVFRFRMSTTREGRG
jgi:hypothetical protein